MATLPRGATQWARAIHAIATAPVQMRAPAKADGWLRTDRAAPGLQENSLDKSKNYQHNFLLLFHVVALARAVTLLFSSPASVFQ